MKETHHSRLVELAKHGFLAFILFFAFIGLYLMIVISLKDNQQFARNPFLPTPPFHWHNYVVGWKQIAPYIFNTIFVAVTTTVLTLVMALHGAFFFARYRAPLSRVMFFLFVILMMYPGIANMVPSFILIKELGLYNTYWALIVPAVFSGQVFTIYVLRNFIEDIPQDYFDAAEIDGAGSFRQVWLIVAPLSAPILGTLAILRLLGEWNNFVRPLLYIRDPSRQLIAVGLLRLEGEYTRHWGEMMAGYSIAAVPLVILFLFTMRLFIRGLSAGGIKG
jgi:ABC-type glycerol-3-phosphate transport system permease component